MFFNISPEVSICIPVYNSEKYLERCLNSILIQHIPQNKKASSFIEVIVVNDGSQGGGSDKTASQIVAEFKKKSPFTVKYLEHSENQGLLEARRTAVYESKGKYILILDSDDSLTDDAVLSLYTKAEETGADIVQGRANLVIEQNVTNLQEVEEEFKKHLEGTEKKANLVFKGDICGGDIFEGFNVTKNHNGFLWGKLFLRELYLNALNHIPSIFCTYAEDFCQYFWISYEARKYTSIEQVVYNYTFNTGISSHTLITDLNRWEKICSTSSVFTAVYGELEEQNISLTQQQQESLNTICRTYLYDNIMSLYKAVSPDIKKEARSMLEDFWGADFVKIVEDKMIEKGMI